MDPIIEPIMNNGVSAAAGLTAGVLSAILIKDKTYEPTLLDFVLELAKGAASYGITHTILLKSHADKTGKVPLCSGTPEMDAPDCVSRTNLNIKQYFITLICMLIIDSLKEMIIKKTKTKQRRLKR